jgi:hypothetical protein
VRELDVAVVVLVEHEPRLLVADGTVERELRLDDVVTPRRVAQQHRGRVVARVQLGRLRRPDECSTGHVRPGCRLANPAPPVVGLPGHTVGVELVGVLGKQFAELGVGHSPSHGRIQFGGTQVVAVDGCPGRRDSDRAVRRGIRRSFDLDRRQRVEQSVGRDLGADVTAAPLEGDDVPGVVVERRGQRCCLFGDIVTLHDLETERPLGAIDPRCRTVLPTLADDEAGGAGGIRRRIRRCEAHVGLHAEVTRDLVLARDARRALGREAQVAAGVGVGRERGLAIAVGLPAVERVPLE